MTCQPPGTTAPPREQNSISKSSMIMIYYFALACSDWDLRLANGANEMQGRLEVCFNEAWGTVCDDFWGTEDAQVVCYQLGFSREGT